MFNEVVCTSIRFFFLITGANLSLTFHCSSTALVGSLTEGKIGAIEKNRRPLTAAKNYSVGIKN